MSLIKTIDSKLMRIITFNMRYPDWSKAPLSLALRIIFLNLLGAAFCILFPIVFDEKGDVWLWVFAAVWLLGAFYHFRLWRRLKAERSK
jgi:hypothetical protein